MPGESPEQAIEDVREPLEEACARNVPLELHSLAHERTIPAARARMIDLDEAHIYLEKPQIIGRKVRIHKTQEFEAFFSFADILFTFKTAVVENNATVRLNGRKLVEGLILERPRAVTPGQRRQFFRTSLAVMPANIEAQIQEAADEDEPVPSETAPWMEARIVDASAGGFGVRIEEPNYSKFKIYRNYFVRFNVPEVSQDLTTLCELRQVRPILDGSATKLGFLLLPWPTQGSLNWQLQPLLSFLTKLQRARMAG